MKDIKIINKPVKEFHSITTLKLGDKEYPLTEKELIQLVTQLYEYREDVFDEIGAVSKWQNEIENLKASNKELEDRVEELEGEVEDLEYELDCAECED